MSALRLLEELAVSFEFLTFDEGKQIRDLMLEGREQNLDNGTEGGDARVKIDNERV